MLANTEISAYARGSLIHSLCYVHSLLEKKACIKAGESHISKRQFLDDLSADEIWRIYMKLTKAVDIF